jgi:tetratricopeptide (TPR) repeat protein
MQVNRIVIGLLGAALLSAHAAAQQKTLPPAAIPQAEGAVLAEGWASLAAGKHEDAARVGARALTQYPRNVSALALVVEADIARGGALRALQVYESWLGARPHDEPGVLRRIARAYLYEWSRQTSDRRARTAALQALANDGDADAAGVLASLAGEAAAPAGKGSDAEVDRIASQIASGGGLKLREIHRLADTANPRAVAPLVATLSDPHPENRAAAAEALGRLGGAQAIAALRPLVSDPHGAVRVAAAGALYKHGDYSGASILQELAVSDFAGVRRVAALLMASNPDESWKSLVRSLATDPDPTVQLDAARMLAPHDPEAARAIFERLMTNENLAIREEAALAFAEVPISDFPTLRRLLRSPQGRAKVSAAGRILTLTR